MVLVAKSKKVRRGGRIIAAMIVLLVLIVVAAGALFVMLGYYVDSLNTVFPNVWYEGINMSGLTREQAKQALIGSGYEERAAQIAVTVNLPFGISYYVNGDDVGLTLNAEEAVNSIMNYGRDGTFLTNEMTYINAFFNKVELNELSRPDYDNTIMRRLAVEHAAIFNESLADSESEITATHIRLQKGTDYLPVTADELLSFTEREFKRAMDEHTHIESNFLPETDYSDDIDISAIFNEIHEEPVSSYYDPALGNPSLPTYDPVNKGATASKNGRTFDLEIAQEQFDELPNGDTLIIPISIVLPELQQSELRDMLFSDVLAESDVSAPSNANRAHNVTQASEAIGTLVMQPGDVFSYNDTVGPRTAARGYRYATAYVGGLKQEEIGGGICQVSSAIYYTLLHTDLEIVTRQPHGMEVTYLKGGLDATVSFGSIDFRFRNNMDLPIRLEVTATGSVSVNVKIIGTRTSDVYYRLESEHTGTQEMVEVRREATEEDNETLADMGITLAPQQEVVLRPGNRGTSYVVWRYHYKDADLEDPVLNDEGEPYVEKMHTDTYRMQQRVIVYNPEPAPYAPPEQTYTPPDDGEAEG